MPHQHGYSIYVALDERTMRHTVRLYRDVDDKHLHSWENCDGLGVTMRDVARRIDNDAHARREARRPQPASSEERHP